MKERNRPRDLSLSEQLDINASHRSHIETNDINMLSDYLNSDDQLLI